MEGNYIFKEFEYNVRKLGDPFGHWIALSKENADGIVEVYLSDVPGREKMIERYGLGDIEFPCDGNVYVDRGKVLVFNLSADRTGLEDVYKSIISKASGDVFNTLKQNGINIKGYFVILRDREITRKEVESCLRYGASQLILG